MNHEPLVTVIIATFNRAHFIEKAIDSVMNQTYTNWELIIWIDGSTDNTLEIVKSYQDDRIRYYFEENHGKCYALNRSIERSNGEWIAILDDDDEWYPDKLLFQISTLLKYPIIDVLFCNFMNENLKNGEIGIGFEQNIRGLEKLSVMELEQNQFLIVDNFALAISNSVFILPSTTLIKKEVIDKVGTFNEELRNSEDFEYWWRIHIKNYNFSYSNNILVKRNKPQNSLSSASLENSQNVIKCLDSCYLFSLEQNRFDLLIILKNSFRKTWLNVFREFGKKGDLVNSLFSLKNSLKYGVSMFEIIDSFMNIFSSKISQSPKLHKWLKMVKNWK